MNGLAVAHITAISDHSIRGPKFFNSSTKTAAFPFSTFSKEAASSSNESCGLFWAAIHSNTIISNVATMDKKSDSFEI